MRVLILLSVVVAVFANQECGENQHYESCGTGCPLTCDNYGDPPLGCILRCNPGCQCDEGYVKTDDGRCVKPEQCPPKNPAICGENQRVTNNECGSACPLTCENYDNPPKVCVDMCVYACECETGYVKTKDGRCVRPEDCPNRAQPICGENQIHNECGSACPLTCENYDNPPRDCVPMCAIGCECEAGYVKTKDGRCVRLEDCPNRTPPAETNCVDEPESGMCFAYFPSYYYDPKSGECKKFIYGGCRGNGNRYPTKEACMAKCEGIRIMNSTDSSACDLPAETGVCRGFFPRFYFDRTTGQCQKFVYGGCGGNENNFQTVDECHRTCASAAPSACREPKVVGSCRAHLTRFYFNQETGKCEEFVYGGCNGNSNNFLSLEDCQAVCEGEE